MTIYKRNPSGGSSGFTKRPLIRPRFPPPPPRRRKDGLGKLFDRMDRLVDKSDAIIDTFDERIENKMRDIDDVAIDIWDAHEKAEEIVYGRNPYLYKFKLIIMLMITLFIVSVSALFILSLKDNTVTSTPLTQEQSVDTPVLKDGELNKL